MEIISCFLVNFYFYFLLCVTRMLVYPYKCRIQPRTMSQVTIYTPLLLPRTHTHTRKAKASVHVAKQMWLWWEEKGDDGRDWVGNNIQGGGRKFLGHLIRHCWSRILSESSKQGHTNRIKHNNFNKKWVLFRIFVLYCAYTPFRH